MNWSSCTSYVSTTSVPWSMNLILWKVYDQVETDEQLKKKVDLTLFQAMMFVAIGVGAPRISFKLDEKRKYWLYF
jgi:hypothetical protein